MADRFGNQPLSVCTMLAEQRIAPSCKGKNIRNYEVNQNNQDTNQTAEVECQVGGQQLSHHQNACTCKLQFPKFGSEVHAEVMQGRVGSSTSWLSSRCLHFV